MYLIILGAGSIMDALGKDKRLVVVTNAALMDNHQEELARAMHDRHYLFSTTPSQLITTLQQAQWTHLVRYPSINTEAFPAVIAQELNVVWSCKANEARQH